MSQNFIRDDRATASLVRALPPADGHPAIEVGTGDGALTQELAQYFGSLTSWEIDEAMAARASRRLMDLPQVTLRVGDFLGSRPPGKPFHLVGNIPFGVTTKIVTWALRAPTLLTATLITQWEFARKHSGDYGRWSRTTVMSWPWFAWSLGDRISRQSFRPVPATDAGLLTIRRRTEPLVTAADEQRWRHDVEVAFLGKGGSLHASLSSHYPRRALDQAFARAALGKDVPVGLVHPDALLTIHAELERAGAQASPRASHGNTRRRWGTSRPA